MKTETWLMIGAAVAFALFVFRKGPATLTPNPATTDPLVRPASTGATTTRRTAGNSYDIVRGGVVVGQGGGRRGPKVNRHGAKPKGIPFGFGF